MFLPLYFPEVYLFDHVQSMHHPHFGEHYFLSWLRCYAKIRYVLLQICSFLYFSSVLYLKKSKRYRLFPGVRDHLYFCWVCLLGTQGQFSLFLSLKCMAPDLARVDFYGFSFQWRLIFMRYDQITGTTMFCWLVFVWIHVVSNF